MSEKLTRVSEIIFQFQEVASQFAENESDEQILLAWILLFQLRKVYFPTEAANEYKVLQYIISSEKEAYLDHDAHWYSKMALSMPTVLCKNPEIRVAARMNDARLIKLETFRRRLEDLLVPKVEQ